MKESLIGKTIGKWAVTGPVEYRKISGNRSMMYYFCRCECGIEKFVARQTLVNGQSTKCPKCGPRRYPIGAFVVHSVLSRYIREAKERNYEWSLSKEEFLLLARQNCFYCGVAPSNITTAWDGSTFKYTGIDRVDNSRGYESDNVVPCCHECNKAKGSKTQEEFIEWALRIAETSHAFIGSSES